MQTTIKLSLLIAVVSLLATGCGSKLGKNKSLGGRTSSGVDGWKDNDTYILVISGQWNRSKYYVEGNTNADTDGKTAKPGIILEQNAKRAAKEQAKRNFLEKVVGSFVEAETGTTDGEIVKDIIRSSVIGTVPSPISVKENYTKNHDVRITFQFHSKGLKKRISDAVNKIIKEQAASGGTQGLQRSLDEQPATPIPPAASGDSESPTEGGAASGEAEQQ